MIQKMRLLGVTATPNRKDKKELKEHFDVMIKGPSIQELQAQGYLSRSVTYLTDLSDLDTVVGSTSSDYKMSELSAYMRNREVIESSIKLYKEKADGKQMLVFCVDTDHLEKVRKYFYNAGYENTASITAKTKNNERAEIDKEV